MEERIKGLRRRSPLLNIIHNEQVDGLVEIDEVVHRVLPHSIRILHLKQASGHIEHAVLGIHLLTTHANGIDEMGLTTTRRAEDEEGIESGLARMLGYGEADCTRQLVTVSFHEVMESLLRIKLWIKILGNGSVQHTGCLVATVCRLRAVDTGHTLTVHLLSQSVSLVGHHPITNTYYLLEAMVQRPPHELHIVLLQIVVEMIAGKLQQQGGLGFAVGNEDDGLEPCFELLLCNVLLNQLEAVVPKRLMTAVAHLA